MTQLPLCWLGLVYIGAHLCACAPTQEGENQLLQTTYTVTVRVHTAPEVFEGSGIHRFDEGYIVLMAQVAEAPRAWTTSRSTSDATDAGLIAAPTHGPVVVHDEIPVIAYQQVALPGFVCAAVTTFPGHRLTLDRPYAVSSKCAPVPPEYAEVSFEEAKAFLPADNRVIDEVFDLVIDKPASKAVVGSHHSTLKTIIDAMAIIADLVGE